MWWMPAPTITTASTSSNLYYPTWSLWSQTTSSASNTWWDQGTSAAGNAYASTQGLAQLYQQQAWAQQAMLAQQQQAVWAQGLMSQSAYVEEITAPAVRQSRHRAWIIQEQARLLAAGAEQRERRLVVERAAKAAGERAHGLLLAHLTPEQRRTFEANKWFVVEGGRSKQRYRIRAGTVVANIDVLDGEHVAHKLCGHINHGAGVPIGDHLLAQKVMLELAEDDFLRLANRHRV